MTEEEEAEEDTAVAVEAVVAVAEDSATRRCSVLHVTHVTIAVKSLLSQPAASQFIAAIALNAKNDQHPTPGEVLEAEDVIPDAILDVIQVEGLSVVIRRCSEPLVTSVTIAVKSLLSHPTTSQCIAAIALQRTIAEETDRIAEEAIVVVNCLRMPTLSSLL